MGLITGLDDESIIPTSSSFRSKLFRGSVVLFTGGTVVLGMNLGFRVFRWESAAPYYELLLMKNAVVTCIAAGPPITATVLVCHSAARRAISEIEISSIGDRPAYRRILYLPSPGLIKALSAGTTGTTGTPGRQINRSGLPPYRVTSEAIDILDAFCIFRRP